MNIAFAGLATAMWVAQKAYYKFRNATNMRRWAGMDAAARERELAEAEKKGNRSATFRFTT